MKYKLYAYCRKRYNNPRAYLDRTLKYIDDGLYESRLKGKICELRNGSTYYKGVYQHCGINVTKEYIFLEDTCKIGGEIVE